MTLDGAIESRERPPPLAANPSRPHEEFGRELGPSQTVFVSFKIP